MKRILGILLMALGLGASAQEAQMQAEVDTLGLERPVAPGASQESLDLPQFATPVLMLPEHFLDVPNPEMPLRVNPKFYEADKVSAAPYLYGFWAAGSRSQMPGLMGIESGQIGYMLQAGRFTFMPYASAAKYGYYGGLTSAFGYGGTLSFMINEHLSLTAFGEHYSTRYGYGWGPMNPAVMNAIGSNRFGGFVTWEISEKLGVNAGAQRVYDPARAVWRTVPIVEPYIKINKQKLGVDVGGLLYELFRGASNSFNGGGGMPGGGGAPMMPRANPRRY